MHLALDGREARFTGSIQGFQYAAGYHYVATRVNGQLNPADPRHATVPSAFTHDCINPILCQLSRLRLDGSIRISASKQGKQASD
jgi:hypothetical protein